MVQRKKFYGYAVVRSDKKRMRSFTIGKNRKELQEKFQQEVKVEDDGQELPHPLPQNSVSTIESNGKNERSVEFLLRKVSDSITSQFELLSMTKVLGPFIQMAAMDQYMIDPANKGGEVIEEKGTVKLIGLPEETYRKIFSETDRVQRIERGSAALPPAILLSIVATFDSNMVDIVRSMLNVEDKFHNFKDKTLDIETILSFSSIEDIKNHVLDSEIYLFSRGSHAEQVKFIEDVFNVSIKTSWPRWSDFIEIFERRNLIAHGEKTYTKRYAQICANHGAKNTSEKIGQAIEIEPDYLLHCIEILLEFSILAIFSIWRKHNRQQESQAFSVINNLSVDLIKNRRYLIVVRILEFVLSLKNTSEGEPTRRRLTINLASALRHFGKDSECNQVLAGMNWEVCSEDFRICVAALKGDIDEVCKLIPIAHATGSISKDNFFDWPVFSFVRNNDRVQRDLTRVYGAPIAREASISRHKFEEITESEIESDVPGVPDGEASGGALH